MYLWPGLCLRFTVPWRWETSKISTMEKCLRSWLEWYCVVFYHLRLETPLISQSAPRAKYCLQIYYYCNFSSDFADVRGSKILQGQWKLLPRLLVAERMGQWGQSHERSEVPKMIFRLNSSSHYNFIDHLTTHSSSHHLKTSQSIVMSLLFC